MAKGILMSLSTVLAVPGSPVVASFDWRVRLLLDPTPDFGLALRGASLLGTSSMRVLAALISYLGGGAFSLGADRPRPVDLAGASAGGIVKTCGWRVTRLAVHLLSRARADEQGQAGCWAGAKNSVSASASASGWVRGAACPTPGILCTRALGTWSATCRALAVK